MQTVFRALRLALCLLIAALATGCATTQSDSAQQPRHEQLYKEALQAQSEGQRDKALQLLDASARANPAYAEPWVKSAQIYFEAGNYPMAIKTADEAMKRDPARRETKAIAVVASLRVAVHALGEMREDASLRGNTRLEAEQLARTLRETLSVETLVPVPIAGDTAQGAPKSATNAAAAKPAPATPPAATAAAPAAPTAAPAARPAPRPVAPRKSVVTAPAPARTEAAPAPSSASTNPFSVLK